MSEAEVKRSLDQVSREALSQLQHQDGAAGSALQGLRGKAVSVRSIIDALEARVETVVSSATKFRSKMVAKLNRAKAEEARNKTALDARRRWLLFTM